MRTDGANLCSTVRRCTGGAERAHLARSLRQSGPGSPSGQHPFVLSSLASISIEQAAELAQENFWFQFYPPTVKEISTDLMARAWNSGCRHLVVTIDVPSAGYRPADIRNGLSVPPKISARNIWQSICRPAWSLATVRHGIPQFASMQPYIPADADLGNVAHYIRNTLKKWWI